MNFSHIPLGRSWLMSRYTYWPYYSSIGCIASDYNKQISYLITRALHYRYYSCNYPKRHVEIIKVNISTTTVIDRLLRSLIVSPINYNDLLVGDKNAVMIAEI